MEALNETELQLLKTIELLRQTVMSQGSRIEQLEGQLHAQVNLTAVYMEKSMVMEKFISEHC